MQLATTCVLLFVGASGAGLVPLVLKTSPAQLRLLSAIGAGLLVGTGLGVILPEGFEAFHTAQEAAGAALSLMHVTQTVAKIAIVLHIHQPAGAKCQEVHSRLDLLVMSLLSC